MRHWSAVQRGGIIVASVYLVTREGPLSVNNINIVQHMAQQLKLIGKPYVVGGDFQMTPEELQTHYGYLFEGEIISPEPPWGDLQVR